MNSHRRRTAAAALGILVAVVLLFIVEPARARTRLSLDGDLLQTVQAVESEFDGVDNDESPGFATSRANLNLYGELSRRLDVYLELHLDPSRSRGSSEVLLDEAYGVWNLWDMHVKLGSFEVEFGNAHWYRTDNARTDDNWFLTNGLVDPHAVQTGVEVAGMGPDDDFAWAVSLTNGVGNDAQAFAKDAEFAVAGKIWGPLTDRISAALSHYRVNQSRIVGTSNLFADTAFVVLEGINPGPAAPPVSVGRDFILGGALGAGQNVTAWQLDVDYEYSEAGVVRAWAGDVEDADVNGPVPGEPRTESQYWGLELRRDLSPRIYVAGGWHRLSPQVLAGSPGRGHAERFTVAAGYGAAEGVRLKVEALYLRRDGLGGVDATISGGMAGLSGRF